MAYGIAHAIESRSSAHEARVDSRFCGPPGSGNGGYAVGLVGKSLGAEVEVTLKRPIPLDASLQVVADGTTAGLFFRGTEIATATTRTLDLDLPEPVGFAEAAAARASFAGYRHHPFPNCFVCGTNRSCGDGMCLFTGEVAGGAVASSWVPNATFANPQGEVCPEIVGAALDCPGAWAFIPRYGIESPVVLGRMTYRFTRPVHAGGRYVVMGWGQGREGRKLFCGTAIYDAEGTVCAAAKATWIQLREAPVQPID